MAKRSRASRFGMLALSFALVFSLTSPTWLFAAELLLPESEVTAPAVEAPVVVEIKEPAESTGSKDAGTDAVEVLDTGGEVEALAHGFKTIISSSDIGTAVCPTASFKVQVVADHDTNSNHVRVIELRYPTALGNPTIIESEASKSAAFDLNDDQNPDYSIISTVADGDFTIMNVRTDETVSSSRPYWRLMFEFDMAAVDVDASEISARSGARYRNQGNPQQNPVYDRDWTSWIALSGMVYAAEAELDVMKTAVRAGGMSIQRGSVVDVTVEVENTGNVDLGPVVVTDQIPAGFTYVAESAMLDAVQVEPSGLPTTPSWTINDLDVDESVTLTYQIVVGMSTMPGSYPAMVAVSADSPCGNMVAAMDAPGMVYDTASVNMVVTAPNLAIKKTADPATTIYPGDEVCITIEVTNKSIVDGFVGPAYNVKIWDFVPAGFALVKGSVKLNGSPVPDPSVWNTMPPAGTPTWGPMGPLDVDETWVITYCVKAGSGVEAASYDAPVYLMADGADPEASPLQATAVIVVGDDEVVDDDVLQTGYNDWLWIAMVMMLVGGAVVAGRMSMRDER